MVFWFIVYGLLFMEDGGEIRGGEERGPLYYSTAQLLYYYTDYL